jgi:hypothetical protein
MLMWTAAASKIACWLIVLMRPWSILAADVLSKKLTLSSKSLFSTSFVFSKVRAIYGMLNFWAFIPKTGVVSIAIETLKVAGELSHWYGASHSILFSPRFLANFEVENLCILYSGCLSIA